MLKCSRHSVPLSSGNVPILPRCLSRFCGTERRPSRENLSRQRW